MHGNATRTSIAARDHAKVMMAHHDIHVQYDDDDDDDGDVTFMGSN